jgi:cyclase
VIADGADLTEVADGVWAYAQHDGSWWINTTGFVVGTRLVAIDACATHSRTRRFLDVVGQTTGRRIDLLVNTHSHGDHTFGNSVFDPTTLVMATEGAAREMAAFAERFPRIQDFTLPDYDRIPDWGAVHSRLPDVTFGTSAHLGYGEDAIELLHFGRPAHTAGDLVAWLPIHRVLFAGDLVFNGGMPLAVGGSVAGSVETLLMLQALQPNVIVPGHGRPCGPEQLDRHLRYWRLVQDAARQAVAAGLTPVEAAHELDLGEFADLGDSERIVMNLHRGFAEVDPGHQFDMLSATRDAVVYSGRPIRCVA